LLKDKVMPVISKELLKSEIDKVKTEYLGLLYRIIKAFEWTDLEDRPRNPVSHKGPKTADLDWHAFVMSTYGSLADAPIQRGEQGRFEAREPME
jgi:hypothetical protein